MLKIAGIVFGVFAIAFLIWLWLRRRRKRRESKVKSETDKIEEARKAGEESAKVQMKLAHNKRLQALISGEGD